MANMTMQDLSEKCFCFNCGRTFMLEGKRIGPLILPIARQPDGRWFLPCSPCRVSTSSFKAFESINLWPQGDN